MGHLPDITCRELVGLLRKYSKELRGEGSPVIVGVRRDGRSFTVHQHPSQKVYRRSWQKYSTVPVSHKTNFGTGIKGRNDFRGHPLGALKNL